MTFLKVSSMLAAICLPVVFCSAVLAASEEHHEGVAQTLSFSAEQIRLANITTEKISTIKMTDQLYAPGEIKANGYTSYLVSPRVESVIVRRHAVLGEHVEQGQVLVTLFSEQVAQAQAAYRIAFADWQRARKVATKALSESQVLNAQTNYIVSFSRLKAYGLTEQAIEKIAQDNSSLLGEYTLQAESSGSVLADNFQQGQRVDAGESIRTIVNETELWVEARLEANNQDNLPRGTKAQILIGKKSYQGKVIQEAHTIDAYTRTRVVRLLVQNDDHQLHPGLFVDVYFNLPINEPVLVVPETALLRGADGDWMLYISEQHQENEHNKTTHPADEAVNFIAKEVTLGRSFRNFSNEQQRWLTWREITGLALNSEVVISGAFFIASQSAKSGFDTHNH